MNDFTNFKRGFNVDIMMLYISAMDHARKLKVSSNITVMFFTGLE